MTRKILVFAVTLAALSLGLACSSQPAGFDSPAASAAKPATAAITPAVLEHGRGLYKANCVACHGDGGKGDGPAAGVLKPAPRDHTDRTYMSTLTDEDLARVIQMGGAARGKPLMPSNPQIKGGDLAALVAYTRSLSTGTQKGQP